MQTDPYHTTPKDASVFQLTTSLYLIVFSQVHETLVNLYEICPRERQILFPILLGSPSWVLLIRYTVGRDQVPQQVDIRSIVDRIFSFT